MNLSDFSIAVWAGEFRGYTSVSLAYHGHAGEVAERLKALPC